MEQLPLVSSVLSSQDDRLFQCRWNWCRNTFSDIAELLVHLREHTQNSEPCYVRDIPMLLRVEEGIGNSMSGLTAPFDSYTQESSNLLLNAGGDASSSSASFSSLDLPDMQERPLKRQRVMPPPSTSSLSNALSLPAPPTHAPQSAASASTPEFSALASTPEPIISNPDFPELDSLISASLSGISRANQYITPIKSSSQEYPGSQDSDVSVERQLTQSFDQSFEGSPGFGGPVQSAGSLQDLHSGQLNWVDAHTQSMPRSRPQTPPHAPQSQPSPGPSQPTSTPRRQSWYQSPRRVSHSKSTASAPHSPPAPHASSSLAQALSPRTPSRLSTPAKGFKAASLSIQPSPPQRWSYDHSLHFGVRSQPSSPGPPSSQEDYSFIPQTQAPYNSQSPI